MPLAKHTRVLLSISGGPEPGFGAIVTKCVLVCQSALWSWYMATAVLKVFLQISGLQFDSHTLFKVAFGGVLVFLLWGFSLKFFSD